MNTARSGNIVMGVSILVKSSYKNTKMIIKYQTTTPSAWSESRKFQYYGYQSDEINSKAQTEHYNENQLEKLEDQIGCTGNLTRDHLIERHNGNLWDTKIINTRSYSQA